MNVKTKVKLMNVMDIYWDLLPPEIHETIMMYKTNQEYFDEKKNEGVRQRNQDVQRVERKMGTRPYQMCCRMF